MEIHTNAGKSAVKQITFGILGACFAYAIANILISVLINDIIDAFSLSGAAQGSVSSLFSVGMFIAFLVTPMMQGRISKITMLLLSCLIQVAMLVLSGLARSFALFTFAIVLLGVGCGWLDSFANSSMVDVHQGDSPKYLGWLHGTFGVGSLVAPLLIAWLLTGMSWRGAYFVTAGVMLLAAVYVAIVRGNVRQIGGMAAIEEKRLSARDVLAYAKSGRNLLLLLCGAMSQMMQTGLLCWIVRYMTVEFNAAALGATCLTIYWITATLNRFLAPRIRMRPLALVILGGVLTAAILVFGVLLHNPVVMCVTVGLAGLTSGHFMPMMVAVCADDYAGNTTMTTSVLMLIMGVTRIIVPLMMAAATSRISANASMMVPAAAALLTAMFGLLARRKDGTQKLA